MDRNFAKIQLGTATVEVPVEVISESLQAAMRAHPDDIAVDRFSAAMKDKLAAARVKGRGGWQDKASCSAVQLSEQLISHIGKGDPVDVANFAMMLHQRNEPIATAPTPSVNSVPPIGSYWTGQAGIHAGIIRGEEGMPDRHLIVPTDPAAEFPKLQWSPDYSEIAGCHWTRYGMRNTAAMDSASIELATKIRALRIEGHDDFYLPARHELRLCYLNVPELFEKDWYWSSTQYSALDAFLQYFEHGSQGTNDEGSKFRARAVRSIQVSN